MINYPEGIKKQLLDSVSLLDKKNVTEARDLPIIAEKNRISPKSEVSGNTNRSNDTNTPSDQDTDDTYTRADSKPEEPISSTEYVGGSVFIAEIQSSSSVERKGGYLIREETFGLTSEKIQIMPDDKSKSSRESHTPREKKESEGADGKKDEKSTPSGSPIVISKEVFTSEGYDSDYTSSDSSYSSISLNTTQNMQLLRKSPFSTRNGSDISESSSVSRKTAATEVRSTKANEDEAESEEVKQATNRSQKGIAYSARSEGSRLGTSRSEETKPPATRSERGTMPSARSEESRIPTGRSDRGTEPPSRSEEMRAPSARPQDQKGTPGKSEGCQVNTDLLSARSDGKPMAEAKKVDSDTARSKASYKSAYEECENDLKDNYRAFNGAEVCKLVRRSQSAQRGSGNIEPMDDERMKIDQKVEENPCPPLDFKKLEEVSLVAKTHQYEHHTAPGASEGVRQGPYSSRDLVREEVTSTTLAYEEEKRIETPRANTVRRNSDVKKTPRSRTLEGGERAMDKFNTFFTKVRSRLVRHTVALSMLFWLLALICLYPSIFSGWLKNEIGYKKGDIEGSSVTLIGLSKIYRHDSAHLKDGALLTLSRIITFEEILDNQEKGSCNGTLMTELKKDSEQSDDNEPKQVTKKVDYRRTKEGKNYPREKDDKRSKSDGNVKDGGFGRKDGTHEEDRNEVDGRDKKEKEVSQNKEVAKDEEESRSESKEKKVLSEEIGNKEDTQQVQQQKQQQHDEGKMVHEHDGQETPETKEGPGGDASDHKGDLNQGEDPKDKTVTQKQEKKVKGKESDGKLGEQVKDESDSLRTEEDPSRHEGEVTVKQNVNIKEGDGDQRGSDEKNKEHKGNGLADDERSSTTKEKSSPKDERGLVKGEEDDDGNKGTSKDKKASHQAEKVKRYKLVRPFEEEETESKEGGLSEEVGQVVPENRHLTLKKKDNTPKEKSETHDNIQKNDTASGKDIQNQGKLVTDDGHSSVKEKVARLTGRKNDKGKVPHQDDAHHEGKDKTLTQTSQKDGKTENDDVKKDDGTVAHVSDRSDTAKLANDTGRDSIATGVVKGSITSTTAKDTASTGAHKEDGSLAHGDHKDAESLTQSTQKDDSHQQHLTKDGYKDGGHHHPSHQGTKDGSYTSEDDENYHSGSEDGSYTSEDDGHRDGVRDDKDRSLVVVGHKERVRELVKRGRDGRRNIRGHEEVEGCTDSAPQIYTKCTHERNFIKKSCCFRDMCEVGNLNESDTMYFKKLYGATVYDIHYNQFKNLETGGKIIMSTGILGLLFLSLVFLMFLSKLGEIRHPKLREAAVNVGVISWVMSIFLSLLGFLLWNYYTGGAVCVDELGRSKPCSLHHGSTLFVTHIIFSGIGIILTLVDSVLIRPRDTVLDGIM